MLLAIEGIAGSGKSTLRDRILESSAHDGVRVGHVGQFSWLSLPASRTIIGLRAGRRAATAEQAVRAVRHDLELHVRYNLALALSTGPVIADRLTLSTACLVALVHDQPVPPYVRHLAEVTAARAELTVLLTTDPGLCHTRLSSRATGRRFGEDPQTAARLAGLYDQAAIAWTYATGLPVLRHACATEPDLGFLAAACLGRLRAASPTATRM